jgi:hypothetical protein
MLAMLGGRERTQQEFEGLCRTANFKLCRIIQAGLFSIIEAEPE